MQTNYHTQPLLFNAVAVVLSTDTQMSIPGIICALENNKGIHKIVHLNSVT